MAVGETGLLDSVCEAEGSVPAAPGIFVEGIQAVTPNTIIPINNLRSIKHLEFQMVLPAVAFHLQDDILTCKIKTYLIDKSSII